MRERDTERWLPTLSTLLALRMGRPPARRSVLTGPADAQTLGQPSMIAIDGALEKLLEQARPVVFGASRLRVRRRQAMTNFEDHL
jgi:hypothetical protein